MASRKEQIEQLKSVPSSKTTTVASYLGSDIWQDTR